MVVGQLATIILLPHEMDKKPLASKRNLEPLKIMLLVDSTTLP